MGERPDLSDEEAIYEGYDLADCKHCGDLVYLRKGINGWRIECCQCGATWGPDDYPWRYGQMVEEATDGRASR